jgi:hypothetical protein
MNKTNNKNYVFQEEEILTVLPVYFLNSDIQSQLVHHRSHHSHQFPDKNFLLELMAIDHVEE